MGTFRVIVWDSGKQRTYSMMRTICTCIRVCAYSMCVFYASFLWPLSCLLRFPRGLWGSEDHLCSRNFCQQSSTITFIFCSSLHCKKNSIVSSLSWFSLWSNWNLGAIIWCVFNSAHLVSGVSWDEVLTFCHQAAHIWFEIHPLQWRMSSWSDLWCN